MDDQEMANDVLALTEHQGLDMLQACYRTSNQVLRQLLIQWVDQNEKSQSKLRQLVEKKGWYLPAPPADSGSIEFVKQFFAEQANELNITTTS